MPNRVDILEQENAALKEELKNIKRSKVKKQYKLIVSFAKFLAGKNLKTSIYNTITEFNEYKKITTATLSDLLASLIKRFTRIGIIALLFMILPTTLIIYQNALFKAQNKKIQDQTYLAEASRRSAQMFIMGDVFSDVNKELKTSTNKTLSNTLVGRIVSLSRAMKPYKYLDNNTLIAEEISPERGQLLITLVKSKIQTAFFVDRILQESDFTKAELMRVNFYNAQLSDANLNGANFKNSNLLNANFKRASLVNANLSNADLEEANLTNANLTNANLTNAILVNTTLKNTNLTSVNLDSARVHRFDWLTHIKNHLKLPGATKLFETYTVDSVYSKVFDKRMPTLLKK